MITRTKNFKENTNVSYLALHQLLHIHITTTLQMSCTIIQEILQISIIAPVSALIGRGLRAR